MGNIIEQVIGKWRQTAFYVLLVSYFFVSLSRGLLWFVASTLITIIVAIYLAGGKVWTAWSLKGNRVLVVDFPSNIIEWIKAVEQKYDELNEYLSSPFSLKRVFWAVVWGVIGGVLLFLVFVIMIILSLI